MKKILCLVLSLIMIIPLVVSATVTGEVAYSESAKNVYIAGDLSKVGVNSGDAVTLTIVEEGTGDVKYIAEIDVNSDLKYETKFKFTDDLSNCDIRINEGNNDVTQSVVAAYITQPTTYSLTLRDVNDSHVIDTDEIIKATAEITNKYGNGGTLQILAAFYDANNKMIACEQIKNDSFTFYDLEKEIEAFSTMEVPTETEKIKVFMWNNTQTIIPLSKEQTKLVGDRTFGGDTEQITVAFMGDSLTHQAQYLKVLEHYYHTRYPDKDIVFINKGISGNSYGNVINRFYWDITENELTGEVDEATLSLGFNDLLLGINWDDEDPENGFEANIEKYLENCKKVIGMCRDKGISLTLVSPAVFDYVAYYQTGYRQYSEDVNEVGLKKMTEEVKKIADEYDLPFIDVWTPTTDISKTVRKMYENIEKKPLVITGEDGVHPGEQGGFYMSYEIIKQQDGNPIVAKVEIDARTGVKATERADVVVTDYGSNKVVYQYLAHAIPVAYTDHYKQFEAWGVPVTEDINQEIIKVTNLDPGNYTIKIGENTLTKTYTDEELSEGVNIAIDDNNPAQLQSKEAHAVAVSKVYNESEYRSIASTEQTIRNKSDISKFESFTKDDVSEAKQALKDLGCTAWTYDNYYDADNSSNYRSKFYEVENWANLRALEQQAREKAKPVERTVIIEKIQ